MKFGPALSTMIAESDENKFPFGSIVPLWSRQVPYTMAKFFFFEKVRCRLPWFLFAVQSRCKCIMIFFVNGMATLSDGVSLPALHVAPESRFLRLLLRTNVPCQGALRGHMYPFCGLTEPAQSFQHAFTGTR